MSITLLSLPGIQYGAELQSYEFITIFLKNETILFKTKGMKQHLSLISKSLEMFFFFSSRWQNAECCSSPEGDSIVYSEIINYYVNE